MGPKEDKEVGSWERLPSWVEEVRRGGQCVQIMV